MNIGEMTERIARARAALSRAEDELGTDEPTWTKVAREMGRVSDEIPELVAEVTLRALRDGATQRSLEETLGLPKGALRGWKKAAHDELVWDGRA